MKHSIVPSVASPSLRISPQVSTQKKRNKLDLDIFKKKQVYKIAQILQSPATWTKFDAYRVQQIYFYNFFTSNAINLWYP